MRLLSKIFILFLLLFFLTGQPFKERDSSFTYKEFGQPIKVQESVWVDSVFNSLNLRQRIAQLFMIDVYSNQNKAYVNRLKKQIAELQPGGLVFMKGTPTAQLSITNTLQEISPVPLFIGIDAETGLAMRLDSLIALPKPMAVGAVQDDQLVFEMGEAVGLQCQRMGIHINFAPVLDVNNNPENPIINYRSYGEDKRNVARKGLAYVSGMQNQQVIAVGKHFPGHGDTHTDSHETLPVIRHPKEHLFDVELYPFQNLIANELIGIMTGHIAVPSLDSGNYRPASLSPIIVQQLLKNQMGFKGLVFTDALNMGGVTRDQVPGEIEVQALLAGNDVLIFPTNLELAINAIEKAVANGRIPESLIDQKCKKIIQAKLWSGLASYKSTTTQNLVKEINGTKIKKNQRLLTEALQTLVYNHNAIPIADLDKKRILCIAQGINNATPYFAQLNQYARVDTFLLSTNQTFSKQQLNELLAPYQLIIVGQFGLSEVPRRRFNISANELAVLNYLIETKPVILNWFGNPYGLKYLESAEKAQALLVSYSDTKIDQEIAAQALFGGIPLTGRLPVSVRDFKAGSLLSDEVQQVRLNYAGPEVFNLDEKAFSKIDSLASFAIDTGATPGCQIIYVKDGRVIYNKYFGFHTYAKKQAVKPDDIYDLASVTKIAATTLALVKLTSERKFDPSFRVTQYLPELEGTDKDKIKMSQLLAHQAGLKSWIPFYRNTLDSLGMLMPEWYSSQRSDSFNLPVARDLYLKQAFVDSVFKSIADTPLYHKNRYFYSDLGFYWLGKIIAQLTSDSLQNYVQSTFYSRLGMQHTGYFPLQRFNPERIVPTENDLFFRRQVIRGYVHDQGAAVLGGVAGHAGLFSNANDMAILGQLFLNKGTYGGESYFSPRSFELYTRPYFSRRHNRRALGFDKPALKSSDPGPTSESASPESYGHSGFTGTYLWVDPQNQSVYVFLSNRTFPNAENKLLLDLNIRTEIQQAFYDVLQH
ncbi:MAG: glycoside hydrolase family 3 N-terminal domain-containing protein [Salinivirgaceae bacterium]